MVHWFGGVERVFAEAADRAWNSIEEFGESDLEAAFDHLMTVLNEVSEDSGERVPLEKIAPPEDAAARALVESLNRERVLSLVGDSPEQLTVAWTFPPGQAKWSRSVRWMEEMTVLESRIEKFEAARQRWQSEKRTPVCLVHASKLIEDARRLLDRHRRWPFLDATLVEFLEASLALDFRLRGEIQELRARRWLWIGGSAAAAVIVVLLMLVVNR